MEKTVLMISMMQRTFMKLRTLVLSIGTSKRMCCRILILMLIEAKRLRLWGLVGSGKSTLLQIMAGLYQLDSGSIRFENMDMFEIDDKDKFESLNVLLQSQQLFDGTIRQNLFTDERDEAVQAIF